MRSLNTYELINADCIQGMRTLPDKSVHCVVTSPPYWGLRDYGHAGQIGLEDTPEAYVARMVQVFREVRRVLRDDGTLWLNLGDSYCGDVRKGRAHMGTGKNEAHNVWFNRTADGLKPKDLVGIPWRVAFALQADGWWLRQDIIWHKPNPMPESVTDRCTKAHEYVFLLTKSERYFYDAEAVSEAATQPGGNATRTGQHKSTVLGHNSTTSTLGTNQGPGTRNRRSVWTITTKPYSGAHFAVMPPDLVEPCIKAGTSEEGCCPACGKPWERVLEVVGQRDAGCWSEQSGKKRAYAPGSKVSKSSVFNTGTIAAKRTTGWGPACTCGGDPVPCTVLDPFTGSGTVGAVALAMGRNFIGTEISPEYVKLAEKRIGETMPMFAQATEAVRPRLADDRLLTMDLLTHPGGEGGA